MPPRAVGRHFLLGFPCAPEIQAPRSFHPAAFGAVGSEPDSSARAGLRARDPAGGAPRANALVGPAAQPAVLVRPDDAALRRRAAEAGDLLAVVGRSLHGVPADRASPLGLDAARRGAVPAAARPLPSPAGAGGGVLGPRRGLARVGPGTQRGQQALRSLLRRFHRRVAAAAGLVSHGWNHDRGEHAAPARAVVQLPRRQTPERRARRAGRSAGLGQPVSVLRRPRLDSPGPPRIAVRRERRAVNAAEVSHARGRADRDLCRDLCDRGQRDQGDLLAGIRGLRGEQRGRQPARAHHPTTSVPSASSS